jgi:pimeloyl-ACP methyl ester carboxylesterase
MNASRRLTVTAIALVATALALPQGAPAMGVRDGGRTHDRASALLSVRAHGDVRLDRWLHSPAAQRKRAAAPPAASLVGGRELMKRASSLHPCTFDDSFLCGSIKPPLDRDNPSRGTVTVRYVVAPHTGSGPNIKGAIFSTSGGPGNSITGSNGEMYPFRDFLWAPLRARYDMVYIDQRGVGRSGALDCPVWQHRAPTYKRARACLRSLGPSRQFYSSAEVADDTNRIRAVLGYDQIIPLGGSYGGNDAVSFAMRHPSRTAAVVAASPVVPVGAFDQFAQSSPEAMPGIVSRLCARSVVCHREYPHAEELVAWMAHRLRNHPVRTVGYDYDGDAHRVTITERLLLWGVLNDSEFPFHSGEVVQAAAALRAGDSVPLARLAVAFAPFNRDWDGGSPRNYSNADNLARYCNDASFPWDVTAPSGVRHQQYEAALAAQPARFGVFSSAAWAAPMPTGFFPDPCITARWTHDPAYEPSDTVSGVPTLVITGDVDIVTPSAYSAHVADYLTDTTVVNVAAAAHNPWFWRACARKTVLTFVRTADVVDDCAGKPIPRYWEPGSFPVHAADAPQAYRQPGDQSRAIERRLATVAVWAVMDGQRSARDSSAGVTRGLRGGTFKADFSYQPPKPDVYHLHRVRFTADSAISGRVTWDWDNILAGPLTVRYHGDTWALHIRGTWYRPSQRVIRVHASVGGRTVRVTVPAY